MCIRDSLSLVENGALSAGHARTLLSFPDEESMKKAAHLAAKEGISVRELERMAKKAAQTEKKPAPARKKNHYFEEVELALGEHLGRKINVSGTKAKGYLQIEFYGEEDLKNLVNSLDLKE